ncbi:hypothetical protein PSYPI_49492, partial [Pseudomonas syringae pv. pisi str. 1704B]
DKARATLNAVSEEAFRDATQHLNQFYQRNSSTL